MKTIKWNYRIFKDIKGNFGVVEVYYDDNDKIVSFSDFIHPHGESERDLEEDLERMAAALNKPTLFESDIKITKQT